jgi:RNA polymerase sigma-70 factor (ECF subfamily)
MADERPRLLATAPRMRRVTPAGLDPAPLSPDELNRLMLAVARTHDRQAFATLFSHFAPRLKGFLLRAGMTGPLAEEIVQETMLAVWQKASYFDPARARLATWIFAIARNQRIDRLRRDRAPPGDRADGGAGPEQQDEAPSAEAVVIAQQQADRLRQAIETLSPEQAVILRLSFFMERPHADIARELGIPLGTVKSRVRLALGRLRGLLDGLS